MIENVCRVITYFIMEFSTYIYIFTITYVYKKIFEFVYFLFYLKYFSSLYFSIFLQLLQHMFQYRDQRRHEWAMSCHLLAPQHPLIHQLKSNGWLVVVKYVMRHHAPLLVPKVSNVPNKKKIQIL